MSNIKDIQKMAAIDKIWINDYYTLSKLRLWAIIYYPKFLWFFYDDALTMDESKFNKVKQRRAKYAKDAYKRHWSSISPDGTLECAIAYYKRAPFNMSDYGADKEATEDCENALKSRKTIESEIKIAVTNTPIRIDRKLKWICPIPEVRTYLHSQCGVTEHWYYKLFWRGKKYFSY